MVQLLRQIGGLAHAESFGRMRVKVVGAFEVRASRKMNRKRCIAQDPARSGLERAKPIIAENHAFERPRVTPQRDAR
jgi:hypothetical protein